VLGAYRVLDLTDERGLLCGQVLADLGADVIQVEPPSGCSARRLSPFAADVEDPEGSLFWWAYARNKRSLCLDLESEQGRAQLLQLADSADFLIESESPGLMSRRGLGPAELAARNPRLIYVSISPFGQQGPKAHWAATDLVVTAAGGLAAMTGDEERRPIRTGVPPQAYHFAAVEAAVAALLASQERLRSGRGQHVDVSAQQAANAATQCDGLSTLVGDTPTTRAGGGMYYGGVKLRLLYPARDGYVSIAFLFGSTFGPRTRRLMEFVHDAGFCDAPTRDKDWLAYGARLADGSESSAEFERVKDCLAAFTRSKTKAELLELALDHKLLIAPVSTVGDLLRSPQLESRGYFRAQKTADGGVVSGYPGPFARFSGAPLQYRRPAPRMDEHGDELRRELSERAPRSRAERGDGRRARPLEGIKIVDLMWAVSGPTATRVFADFGATVVRVESTRHVDASRTLRPSRGGTPGGEESALFHSLNVGKRMLSLDIRNEAGREVLLDLVRWADVATEAFAPGVMDRLGLAYDALREVNPQLIMLSTNLMGQSGPLSSFAGYGNMASAWCGFYEITGWPDLAPVGPWGAYTDHVAARYNTIAVLAALEHREQTGEGQYIDLSQAEASLQFLAPAFLDCTVNGREASRAGNADREMAPHDVYAVRGEDRWIAIAIATQEQWEALCGVLGDPKRAGDARFADAQRRREAAGELEPWISGCTSVRDASELEAALQSAGVPAHIVQGGAELARDPQLAARGHFIELPHPDGGKTAIEGSRFHLSETPAMPGRETPTLGKDNDFVLREILGYDDDRITEIIIAGALD